MILFLKNILFVVTIFLSVAFITLFERKLLAAVQRRKGPNVVGFLGLLQALSDGIKLLLKEVVVPLKSSFVLLILAPLISLLTSILSWVVIPFDLGVVLADLNLGLLFIFGISSLGVYSILLAGWSSNSRYAFLGSLRSAAQMISYEVSFGLILLSIFFVVGSLNLTTISVFQDDVWFFLPFFPLCIMCFVSMLAETNRPPFDLPEAEAELVSGYNVEYSSSGFVLFFLAEYSNIILMSHILVLFFFGGFSFFSFKVLLVLFFFVLIRAAFPRYRYDQLMRLGWKVFLPFSLGFFLFVTVLLFLMN